MEDAGVETLMVHFECLACGMNATCVATEAAERAWRDHMTNHQAVEHYRAVWWAAMQLPFQ